MKQWFYQASSECKERFGQQRITPFQQCFQTEDVCAIVCWRALADPQPNRPAGSFRKMEVGGLSGQTV
jgi:hypothetical protein